MNELIEAVCLGDIKEIEKVFPRYLDVHGAVHTLGYQYKIITSNCRVVKKGCCVASGLNLIISEITVEGVTLEYEFLELYTITYKNDRYIVCKDEIDNSYSLIHVKLDEEST